MNEYGPNDSFDSDGKHTRQMQTAKSLQEFLKLGRDQPVRDTALHCIATTVESTSFAQHEGVSEAVMYEARCLLAQLKKLQAPFSFMCSNSTLVAFWVFRTAEELLDILQKPEEEERIKALIAYVRRAENLLPFLNICPILTVLNKKQKEEAAAAHTIYESLKILLSITATPC